MRNILVVGFLSSSLLLHAQAVTKGSSANLEAKNDAAGALLAHGTMHPATDATTTQQPLRISTGVIAPKLISEPDVHVSADEFPLHDPAREHLIVSFTVDENGKPQNVHLLKSLGQTVDGRVLSAVRQYRFIPATLDNQRVPVDVNMRVNFAQK